MEYANGCHPSDKIIVFGESNEIDQDLCLDADSIGAGTQLVCPVHTDLVIFVFGSQWWKDNGGSLETNAKIKAWCYRCQKEIEFDTWSWRG